jgi:hypothetical protein
MIKLLSVHIPKTAGTSFKNVLLRMYGDRLVQVYDYHGTALDGAALLRESPQAEAIHGHFRLDELRLFCPSAKTVTWLRDPISRIESYYYYWLARPPHGNPNHDRFINESWDIVRLAEFLQDEVADHYLAGTDISAVDFVGLMEHIDEDIERFFSWVQLNRLNEPGVDPIRFKSLVKNLPLVRNLKRKMPHANVNKAKQQLSPETRVKLESVLEKEFAYYRKALEMRRASV